jgi:hypothetical protein
MMLYTPHLPPVPLPHQKKALGRLSGTRGCRSHRPRTNEVERWESGPGWGTCFHSSIKCATDSILSPVWFPYVTSSASSMSIQRRRDKPRARTWTRGTSLAGSPTCITHWELGFMMRKPKLPTGVLTVGRQHQRDLWGSLGNFGDYRELCPQRNFESCRREVS